MEVKVKIIKCSIPTYWYNDLIGYDIIVNDRYLRNSPKVFHNFKLTDEIREKIKNDIKPERESDYTIIYTDTNYNKVLREEKLKKIKKINE